MPQSQKDSSAKLSTSDNVIQQDIGRSQGQVIGQMYGGQAVDAKEIGVFVSGGSVVFQSIGNANLPYTLHQTERTVPSLLPYLPNRSNQEFELGQAIQVFFKQEIRRPLICIVHGDEFQCHDKFLERLQKVSLPRLMKLDPDETVIKKYHLDWPSSLKNLKNLPERLSKNLADTVEGYSFASLDQINHRFCQYPGPVIVHTHLYSEHWQQQGFEILHELLTFWNHWPDLAQNQNLLVCLFVTYQVKQPKPLKIIWIPNPCALIRCFFRHHHRQKLNQQIHQKLEELAASQFDQFDRLSGIILPELTGISRMQVESWVRSEDTKMFVGEAMLEKLLEAVREMFDQWEAQTTSNTIPMNDVGKNLFQLLESLKVAKGELS
ncbi:MAG: hypothetical protein QNJ46_12840 [Leptolyngbyaceae cyanobacterium MO_188.B28]|nr:hypothetical protein [Leptolyngbyaceae cyanobacterium MO_188.B28]